MGLFSYGEVAGDSEVAAREAEAAALEEIIRLLELAEEKGRQSVEAVSALYATRQVWAVLIEDLGSVNNAMPKQLRADLISIGLWVIRESESIRRGNSENFKGIIDITRMIKEGLA
jgi:flagellar protein FlaF